MGTALPKVSADYGKGFGNGLMVRGLPLHVAHPGEVFWVDENASRTGRGTFRAPDTSIDTAHNRCVAGRGDIIMVKPGHVENGTGTSFITCDLAGVAIVGLGRGDDQACISFATSADSCFIAVSAENVTFVNTWFLNTIDDLDGAVRVAAGGDYFSLEGCRISALATSGYETFLTLAAGANFFGMYNCDVDMSGDDDGESLIKCAGTSYNFEMIGNRISMAATAAIVDADAGAITGTVLFKDNVMNQTETTTGLCVAIAAATKGIFINERYMNVKNNTVPASDLSASVCVGCMGTDAVAVAGIAFPATNAAWS